MIILIHHEGTQDTKDKKACLRALRALGVFVVI